MELVDWIKEDSKDSMLGHYLIESMVAVQGGLAAFGDFNSEALEVEMKVNGVEVPFRHFFGLIDKHFSDYEKKLEEEVAESVLREKRELLKERLGDVFQEVLGIKSWE